MESKHFFQFGQPVYGKVSQIIILFRKFYENTFIRTMWNLTFILKIISSWMCKNNATLSFGKQN